MLWASFYWFKNGISCTIKLQCLINGKYVQKFGARLKKSAILSGYILCVIQKDARLHNGPEFRLWHVVDEPSGNGQ